jgi:hypothetical protein
MKKYTKKDFLDYATAFDYTFDLESNKIKDKRGNILSDDDYKKQMKSWSLKDFQEFYGFSYNKDD